jgi:hydrogenase-4 component F
MLLLCGAGLALALLGVSLLHRGAAGVPSGVPNLGFVLLLLGYGALAGLAPLNAWLPRAAAVAASPVAALVAGLLPPAALHALLRAADAAGPMSGVLPPATLLAAVGLATAALAATAAWRLPSGAAAKGLPGWGAAGLAGLAAVGFGLGGAAGTLAGVLLLLGLPFCVGAAVFGAAMGGPVAALGRLSLAGMPPFVPFVALVSLFSAVAALPAVVALPLGAALLAVAAAQLGAVGRKGGGALAVASRAAGRGALLLAVPAWVLLGVALALGAALPEAVATALAGAVAGIAR